MPNWKPSLGALIALVSVSSCSNQNGAASGVKTKCSELASKSSIDEGCAIELAKLEIARRQGKQDYTRFTATLDEAVGAWAVMAAVEPNVPGGHVFVSITLDGNVRDYMIGR